MRMSNNFSIFYLKAQLEVDFFLGVLLAEVAPLNISSWNQHFPEQEVALLVFRSQNLKTSFLCDSQGLSEPRKNLVQLLQWSFLIRTKARRMTGTVIPTRMAVLSGSVEMGCDQDVSLNLSLAELARI